MLTLHIYARLQERSEDFCVCLYLFLCICMLGKVSKKAKHGSCKTRSYILIFASQSCKKCLLT